MGNCECIYAYSVSDQRSISLSLLEKVQDLDYCRIWKNKNSGHLYEEYTIFSRSGRSLEEQFAIYERRRQQEVGLVDVHYVENISIKDCDSASCWQFKVFTERIPVTLNQISSIPLASALNILKKAFVAFNILFKQVGYFDVVDNLIGVNLQSQPKFWLDHCWASNDPSNKNSRSRGNLIHQEGIMVKKIFQVVESHMKYSETSKYHEEKNKIQQWTFELASAFIDYFIKSEQIPQVFKISYAKKYSNLEIQSANKTEIRREFSLKDPNYSLNINIPDISVMKDSMSTFRQNSNSKRFMFESSHFQFKGLQEKLNQKQKQQDIPSPKSIGGRSSSGITGLGFKRNSVNKNYVRKNDKSIAKSTCSNGQVSNTIMDFSQKRKLLEDKIKDLKIQKQQGMSALNVNKQKQVNSFIKNQKSSSNKGSQIQGRCQISIKDKKFQTKSVVSNSQVYKFKAQKQQDGKTCDERSSRAGQSKIFSIDFNLIGQNNFNNNTMQSNGFYTPMAKPRSFLIKPTHIQTRAGLVFSEISHKATPEQSTIRTPSTASPLLHAKVKETQQSQIIAQSNQQIIDFPDKLQETRKGKTFLSQSITIDELMIEPKKNDKSLSMLDMLMVKKTIEKMQGQQNCEQIDMKNPNIMVQSIIEPLIVPEDGY